MRHTVVGSVLTAVAVLAGASEGKAPDDGPADGKRTSREKEQQEKTGNNGKSGNETDQKATKKKGAAARFDPVVRKIEGWTVHVEPTLIDGRHKQMGARSLEMLGDHLRRISLLVTGDRLRKLKRVEIWIEHRHPELGGMQYHPSVAWLKNRGHDPRLAKKVHITRAKLLLSRHQMVKHPWVVLHELAHAYHDQFLGVGCQMKVDHPERVVLDAKSSIIWPSVNYSWKREA